MTVTALLFASYAEALGSDRVELTLAGDTTVRDVVERLRAMPGGAALPATPLVAVNLDVCWRGPARRERRRSGHHSARGRRMSVRTAIVRRAIDVAALLAEVEDTANGATIVFLGQVREVNDGRAVTGIEYSAYGEMAERELAAIASECAATFGTTHLGGRASTWHARASARRASRSWSRIRIAPLRTTRRDS